MFFQEFVESGPGETGKAAGLFDVASGGPGQVVEVVSFALVFILGPGARRENFFAGSGYFMLAQAGLGTVDTELLR